MVPKGRNTGRRIRPIWEAAYLRRHYCSSCRLTEGEQAAAVIAPGCFLNRSRRHECASVVDEGEVRQLQVMEHVHNSSRTENAVRVKTQSFASDRRAQQ